MRTSTFLALASMCPWAALIAIACSSLPTAQQADTIAIDLTNAVCVPLEAQPAGQPWVDIVCSLAQATEGAVSTLALPVDAGAAPLPGLKHVTVRLPAGEAAIFLSQHQPK
jgi:hypothetical protein